MPPRKKTPSAAKKAPVKHFTFQLTLSGVAGIALTTFCLFLWMFFLGIWAGKTIISPCPTAPIDQKIAPEAQLESTLPRPDVTDTSAICVQPRERKRRISPREPSLYQGP
ncbi:MAG: hypothetical protein WGN25_02890 [Candidatus Electrothrix sp. GW3-4]|uniref:hypothetical protein n=1 Tax=Candidatus Electrothrix sp. GW3-4 TaxID=3126740 RepID=UPI0030D62BC8